MRYTCSIDLNVTSAKAAVVFSDRKGKKHWINGLQSHELISGDGGMPESVSKIVIRQGKSTIELKETIVSNKLPSEHVGRYEHRHMVNTMTTRFLAIGDNLCRYECEINYSRFIGFLPKIIMPFMRRRFKKQTQAMMLRFKDYVENEKPGIP